MLLGTYRAGHYFGMRTRWVATSRASIPHDQVSHRSCTTHSASNSVPMRVRGKMKKVEGAAIKQLPKLDAAYKDAMLWGTY